MKVAKHIANIVWHKKIETKKKSKKEQSILLIYRHIFLFVVEKEIYKQTE